MHKNIRKSQLQDSSLSLNNQSNIQESRINLIEQNLSRICLQQDALMPLLQVIEMIPQLTKSDNNLKMISKRIEEQENKNQKNEKLIEKALRDATNQNNNNIKGSAESKQNIKFDLIQKQFKDMENSFNNLFKCYEAKIKEEIYLLQKNFDKKIENNKKDILEFLKKDTQKNDIQKLKEEIQNNVEKEIIIKCDEKINCEFQDLKQNIDNEIRYVYKEIGGLRCEMDFIIYQQRQKLIAQKFPNLQDIKQNQQLYNYQEYDIFLTELEQFDRQNSEKLLYEIDLLKKELESNLNFKNNELDFLMERNINLQYQIQGRKKKIAVDLKIIENKNQFFQKIDKLDNEYDMQIENLDQRVLNLMENVYNNIDNCNKEILKIGELINQKIIQQNQQDNE